MATIITIDGPAVSGKSTVARLLATELGYFYLCSGLLYRAFAFIMLINRDNTIDRALCEINDIKYMYDKHLQERILFRNRDITPYLKELHIDYLASFISADPRIRKVVTQLQRTIANDYNLVVDGRDAGSVAFPRAQYKFFLTSPAKIRAARWRKSQSEQGRPCTLKVALERIEDRDKHDTQRKHAPLIIPHNAVVIDNSKLTVQKTLDKMIGIIKNQT